MSVIERRQPDGAFVASVESKKIDFRVDFQTSGDCLNSKYVLDEPCGNDGLGVLALPSRHKSEDDRRADRAIETPGRIAVIEPQVFLRECILRGMRSKFALGLDTFASVDEFEQRDRFVAPIQLIILSCSNANEFEMAAGRASLEKLLAIAPGTPVVVLASRQDPDFMRVALGDGAKGFIPMSMGFDLAVEAARFVLAGGTYVPAELLVGAAYAGAGSVRLAADLSAITTREMLVIRAIQQGKPNKVIAYDLNMCENTVKVHVRNLMRKLGAKNRTELAVKSKELATEIAKAR